MKTFVIEEKFVGYADITIEAETEEEAMNLYRSGNYKDSNYIIDDMTQYVENQSDTEFLEDCRNYWEDYFDEVIEEVKEYANSDFKKSIEDRRAE